MHYISALLNHCFWHLMGGKQGEHRPYTTDEKGLYLAILHYTLYYVLGEERRVKTEYPCILGHPTLLPTLV